DGVGGSRRLLGTVSRTGMSRRRNMGLPGPGRDEGDIMNEVRSIADAIAACGLPESTGAAFEVPWQAQLFAITLALHEAGHFDWPEWAACLSQSIRDAQAAGDPDLGDTYWSHWLT